MKTVGEYRSWDESYWAWAVTNGKVVLVRCSTAEDAKDEQDRMRNSSATKIGRTNKKVSELVMRKAMREGGLKVTGIRL